MKGENETRLSAQFNTSSLQITHVTMRNDTFCEHITDHNSLFSKGTIKGVLTDTVTWLKELLLTEYT